MNESQIIKEFTATFLGSKTYAYFARHPEKIIRYWLSKMSEQAAQHQEELERLAQEIEGEKLIEAAIDPESLMWKQRINYYLSGAAALVRAAIKKE